MAKKRTTGKAKAAPKTKKKAAKKSNLQIGVTLPLGVKVTAAQLRKLRENLKSQVITTLRFDPATDVKVVVSEVVDDWVPDPPPPPPDPNDGN